MSVRVQLLMTEEDAAALRRLAREMGVSMAGWVRGKVRREAREKRAAVAGWVAPTVVGLVCTEGDHAGDVPAVLEHAEDDCRAICQECLRREQSARRSDAGVGDAPPGGGGAGARGVGGEGVVGACGEGLAEDCEGEAGLAGGVVGGAGAGGLVESAGVAPVPLDVDPIARLAERDHEQERRRVHLVARHGVCRRL